MYGGAFVQQFGFYIQQTQRRLGFLNHLAYDQDRCPIQIQELSEELAALQRDAQAGRDERQKTRESGERDDAGDEQTYETEKEAARLERRLHNYFENITREEFGFRRIGNAYVHETILVTIIARLFPDHEIARHHRPKWLEGLELDIFIPEMKLGFEYQGQQHYKAVKAWGGHKALEELQARDAKKRRLCRQHGVRLVEIDYTEPLVENHIKIRLQETS